MQLYKHLGPLAAIQQKSKIISPEEKKICVMMKRSIVQFNFGIPIFISNSRTCLYNHTFIFIKFQRFTDVQETLNEI